MGMHAKSCLFSLVILSGCYGTAVVCEGGTTAMFVFGDSLFDPGNNEILFTVVRADRPPYGRDFKDHRPTGRFCNGLLSSDIVASLAGLPLPPAYLLDKENIMSGTSFASSGAGIMNRTGHQRLQKADFYQQVGLFSEAREKLLERVGGQKAQEIVSKAVFLVCLGNNDYLANHVGNPWGLPYKQPKVSPNEFRAHLISIYEQNLMELYLMGARKFALVSVSVIGCIPFELLLSHSRDGSCNIAINEEVKDFNSELLALSFKLQAAHNDAHFTFLNSYDILAKIISNPAAYGFKNGAEACCGTGPFKGLPCYRAICSVCTNASEYVFWDFAHPTEALNTLLANTFWAGTYPDVSTLSLQQLFAL